MGPLSGLQKKTLPFSLLQWSPSSAPCITVRIIIYLTFSPSANQLLKVPDQLHTTSLSVHLVIKRFYIILHLSIINIFTNFIYLSQICNKPVCLILSVWVLSPLTALLAPVELARGNSGRIQNSTNWPKWRKILGETRLS